VVFQKPALGHASAVQVTTFGCFATPAGRQPDVLEPEFHGARTHWIRGSMAFRLDRHARMVMLTVPV